MNCRLSRLVVTFLALSVFPPLVAGKGGGHGGGGHGAGHAGGHSGGGSSSGHSFSHSVGHSLSHIFGHRSGGHGARLEKNPIGDGFGPPRPLHVAHSRARRRMFPGHRFFSSGYCDSFRFSWRRFLLPGEFDCFDDGFLLDPFFYGASWNAYFWSDSLIDSGDSANSSAPAGAVDNDMGTSGAEPGAAAPLPPKAGEPVALLQLLDGSMYGVTRYWLVGTTLHYLTTYGGENNVPLERVDFANTQRLNAERGTRLDLTQNSRRP